MWPVLPAGKPKESLLVPSPFPVAVMLLKVLSCYIYANHLVKWNIYCEFWRLSRKLTQITLNLSGVPVRSRCASCAYFPKQFGNQSGIINQLIHNRTGGLRLATLEILSQSTLCWWNVRILLFLLSCGYFSIKNIHKGDTWHSLVSVDVSSLQHWASTQMFPISTLAAQLNSHEIRTSHMLAPPAWSEKVQFGVWGQISVYVFVK